MRIRSLFPAIISPQSIVLFQATWQELSLLEPAYSLMYIQEDRQSRLEDGDGLPYTLDFLILEELDFMQACLRAPPVRAQLEQELQNQAPENSWVTQVMKLAVAYAQITTEEEGLWDVDVNIFLSEETSVTANYTPRTACGDLVIKLGEWLTEPTVNGLLTYTRALYSESKGWKAEEAALYVLNQLLSDFQDVEKQISPDTASGYVDFIRYAMQQPDAFLRARGYLVAGSLTRTSGDALQQLGTSFLEASLQAIPSDESDVVQVSCIRALQYYLQALPHATTQPIQNTIIMAISNYLAAQDMSELSDSEDLMVTLVETLRDAILIDTRICITDNGLDTLFRVASHQANNFQLTMLVTEAFEEVTETIARMGGDAYVQLCARVLPSLMGAFDVGSLTEENALCNFAADLLAVLAEHGPEPLPAGFVATTMPKLTRVLLGSTDEELLKSATTAVKNIISHDHQQLFEWRDDTGKAGLEVTLIIVSRLLSSCSDHAAGEVGALAAEVVEKAGHERLGPYLEQLLRSVAVRLAQAGQAQFIQSLTLVFARLSLNHASEVVDFLAGQDIEGQNGLQVVLAKWLENSINFAGYDEIRQKYVRTSPEIEQFTYERRLPIGRLQTVRNKLNSPLPLPFINRTSLLTMCSSVIALSKLYDLKDPRVAQVQVQGDLIPNNDGRIMTRSRAKNSKLLPSSILLFTFTLSLLRSMSVMLWSMLVGYRVILATKQCKSFFFFIHKLTLESDPDKYTIVPAPLKILKVLVVELQSASGAPLDAQAAAELAEEDSGDDDWEDEVNPFVDLGSGFSREQLMAFAAEEPGGGRQRDDETQGFLVDFFKRAATTQGFAEEFGQLTEEEQQRLRDSAA